MFQTLTRIALCTALIAAVLPAPSRAQAGSAGTLDEVVAAALERHWAPGAVVAVVLRDSVVLLQAWGRTGHAPSAAPLTPDAVFRAGPVTEVVNALAAAQLAHTGALDLDAAIGRLVPELPAGLKAITPHQLLSHTAGLAVREAVPGRGGADDLGAAARGLTMLDRVATPGTLYSHSTLGVSLAGLVVERSGRGSYPDIVRRHVLEPLGMSASALDAASGLTPGWARSSSIEGPIAPARPSVDRAVMVPVSGLVTTAPDLARLVTALLNDGRVDGEQRIPAGVVASLFRARAAVPGGTSTAAPGMRIGRWNGHNTVTVAGGGGGHGVIVHMLPAARLGVVVLSNMSGAAMGEVASWIMERAVPAADAAPQQQPAPADPAILGEMAAAAGRYLNGSELLEIVVKDGSPVLRSDQLELDLTPLPGGIVAASLGTREMLRLRFLYDADGNPYLWIGQRALTRATPPASRRRP